MLLEYMEGIHEKLKLILLCLQHINHLDTLDIFPQLECVLDLIYNPFPEMVSFQDVTSFGDLEQLLLEKLVLSHSLET